MDEADLIEATRRLRDRLGPLAPEALLVLGSGLGGLAGEVRDPVEVPFAELPGFPPAGVPGHAGRYVGGLLEGRPVLVQGGRFHHYEGHPPALTAAPVRVAAMLGVRTAILTNAAGGVDPGLAPGTIVLLRDHLNLQGRSPLVGPVVTGEERFPDMTAAYDAKLAALAEEVARELDVLLPRGVYAGVLGPSYETPAEVRMLAALGADVVGMSTVPEVIAARARGLRVLAFSVVTNRAAGVGGAAPLSHAEVLEVGRDAAEALSLLVRGVVARLP